MLAGINPSTQESTLGKIFEETKPLVLKLLSGNSAVIDDQLRTQEKGVEYLNYFRSLGKASIRNCTSHVFDRLF